jgi:DNA-binding MltR family transcriptional regulator
MASNREALRKLSRKYPAPPEIEKILDSLRDKDDISVAIMATALTDAALEQTIKAKLRTTDANLLGRIFLNRGPLSDFDSKILVAHGFGIITTPLADELHAMKAIRNAFAHAKIPLSFDHEAIDTLAARANSRDKHRASRA